MTVVYTHHTDTHDHSFDNFLSTELRTDVDVTTIACFVNWAPCMTDDPTGAVSDHQECENIKTLCNGAITESECAIAASHNGSKYGWTTKICKWDFYNRVFLTDTCPTPSPYNNYGCAAFPSTFGKCPYEQCSPGYKSFTCGSGGCECKCEETYTCPPPNVNNNYGCSYKASKGNCGGLGRPSYLQGPNTCAAGYKPRGTCNLVWPGCEVAGTAGCFSGATTQECACLDGQEQCETETTEEGCIALSNHINPVTKSCAWKKYGECECDTAYKSYDLGPLCWFTATKTEYERYLHNGGTPITQIDSTADQCFGAACSFNYDITDSTQSDGTYCVKGNKYGGCMDFESEANDCGYYKCMHAGDLKYQTLPSDDWPASAPPPLTTCGYIKKYTRGTVNVPAWHQYPGIANLHLCWGEYYGGWHFLVYPCWDDTGHGGMA